MGELSQRLGEVDEQTRREYGDSALQVESRWDLHLKYASPPIGEIKGKNYGIEGEMIQLLELNEHTPDQTIIDVGCGDGRFLRNVRELGYRGNLIGINYPGGTLFHPDIDKYDISFITGDAREIPLADNSADMVTANFCFYHMDNWQAAMHEIYRILKPGGRLLVATREEDHQHELWRFSQLIAEDIKHKIDEGTIAAGALIGDPQRKISPRRIKIVPPQTYYSHFNFEDLKAFRQLFELEDSYRQISENHWPVEDWLGYAFAVLSLWESFKLVVKGKKRGLKKGPDEEYFMEYGGPEVTRSIDQRVMPIYMGEADKRKLNEVRKVVMEKLNNGETIDEADIDSIKGYFTEYIRQGFDIFRKPKTEEEKGELAEHIGRAAVL